MEIAPIIKTPAIFSIFAAGFMGLLWTLLITVDIVSNFRSNWIIFNVQCAADGKSESLENTQQIELEMIFLLWTIQIWMVAAIFVLISDYEKSFSSFDDGFVPAQKYL